MINESHSLGLGETATVASGNKSDTQRMKGGINPGVPEHLVNPAVFVLAKIDGGFLVLQSKKKRAQLWVNRNSEVLSWVSGWSFCVRDFEGSRFKVDVIKWNGTLRKTTTGIEADLERYPHPFRLIRKRRSQLFYVGSRKLFFDFGGITSDSQGSYWVTFREVEPDSFIQKLRKKFQFKQRGVASDLAPENISAQSPRDIISRVGVLDLPRVSQTASGEESFDRSPRACVSLPAATLLNGEVTSDVAGNPRNEGWRAVGRTYLAFLGADCFCFALSLAGIFRAVVAQAERLLLPQAGVEVTESNEPKRRVLILVERGHEATLQDSNMDAKNNPNLPR